VNSIHAAGWAVARKLGEAARALGLAGLHDARGIGSVLVPSIRNGSVETTRLRTAPPVLQHALDHPPRSLDPDGRFERAFISEELPFAPSTLLRLSSARLVGADAVLVDPRNGRAIADSVPDITYLTKLPVLRRPRLLGRRRRLAGHVCVLAAYPPRNYFHFVTDELSRLYAFSDAGSADLQGLRDNAAETTFVVDAAGPPWQREFLRLLGLRSSTIELDNRANLIADELVFPTYVGPQHPVFGGVVFPSAVMQWLGRVLCEAAGTGSEDRRRLYITRQFAATRRLSNEAAVSHLLETRGFETIAPEDLSVRDQIRAFATAEAVVAPHGAGLTNMLFGASCSVVELLSPEYLSPCYYLLSEALGHSYWYVLGRLDGIGQFADYTVDPARLAATLEAALIQTRSTIRES